MELPIIIIFLGVLIFSAHLFGALFNKTKVPSGLLLLLIGIVLGPVTGLVVPDESEKAIGSIFATVTLVILLFESGVNLKIGELIKSIGSAFFLTIFNFVASAAIATSVAYFMTSIDNWLFAAYFGIIVAGTSSAVVIPMIKQLKMGKSGETTLMLESALSDVLCLVIGLALLTALEVGKLDMAAIGNSIWQSFLIAAGIGILGGIIWSLMLNFMRKVQNNIFTNLAFVLIIYGLTEYLKLNGGIATLMFGITLGNAHLLKGKLFAERFSPQPITDREKAFFSELVFILATFFFVYVGLNMQFNSVVTYVVSFLIVFLIILVRPFSIKIFVRQKMSFKDLSVMSIMAPKGLVPAILATLPFGIGVMLLQGASSPEEVAYAESLKAAGIVIQDLSYAVVFLSILLCALLVIIISKDPLSLGYLKGLLFGKSTDKDGTAIEGDMSDVPAADEPEMGGIETDSDNGNSEIEPLGDDEEIH